jgi:hypothetical protein
VFISVDFNEWLDADNVILCVHVLTEIFEWVIPTKDDLKAN